MSPDDISIEYLKAQIRLQNDELRHRIHHLESELAQARAEVDKREEAWHEKESAAWAMFRKEQEENARLRAQLDRIAAIFHYPACWDTAAYPTIADAVHEKASFECDNGMGHHEDVRPGPRIAREPPAPIVPTGTWGRSPRLLLPVNSWQLGLGRYLDMYFDENYKYIGIDYFFDEGPGTQSTIYRDEAVTKLGKNENFKEPPAPNGPPGNPVVKHQSNPRTGSETPLGDGKAGDVYQKLGSDLCTCGHSRQNHFVWCLIRKEHGEVCSCESFTFDKRKED